MSLWLLSLWLRCYKFSIFFLIFGYFFMFLVPIEILSRYPVIKKSSHWFTEGVKLNIDKFFQEKGTVLMATTLSSCTFLQFFRFLPVFVGLLEVIRNIVMTYWSVKNDTKFFSSSGHKLIYVYHLLTSVESYCILFYGIDITAFLKEFVVLVYLFLIFGCFEVKCYKKIHCCREMTWKWMFLLNSSFFNGFDTFLSQFFLSNYCFCLFFILYLVLNCPEVPYHWGLRMKFLIAVSL